MVLEINQAGETSDHYVSPFPDPWVYFGVDPQDNEDLLQLYAHTYLADMERLQRTIAQIMWPPESVFARQQPLTQSADAHHAAVFFVVADFLAMKYFRYHPKLTMRDMPKDVLAYLRYPYNQMTSLGYEDQKRFRASLPPEHQKDVLIDE